MDPTNKRIISELARNSRIPVSRLADKLRLSGPAVHNRIRSLEEKKFIRQYSLIVDPSEMNVFVVSLVLLKTDSIFITENAVPLKEKLCSEKGVGEIHVCAGEFDYFLKVFAATMPELEETLQKIRDSEGVVELKEIITLDCVKTEQDWLNNFWDCA